MGKLTTRACEAARAVHSGRDRMLGDGDGLFLRVRPHGTKTWVVEYMFRDTRRKFTIGSFDALGAPGESISKWLEHGRLSLAQARAIAGHWRAERRAGRDPVSALEAAEAKKRVVAQARLNKEVIEASQPTVSDAIDVFTERHLKGKRSAAAMRYRLDRLTALIGEKKIRDISRQEVVAAIDRIAEGQHPGRNAKQLAGEVLVFAKRLWRFAETREWVAVSCIGSLVRKDFDARPGRRTVALRFDELAQLWRALDDPSLCKADRITVAALRLLILTGQREREVTDAEWFEMDLDAGLWRIPAARTKVNRAHLVHLAPQVVAILESLKLSTGRSRYVFPSPVSPKQPIFGRSVNNALRSLFDRELLPNVSRCTVHDLRRTLITRLPDLGIEPFIGHKIANHVLPGVLAHYNHNEYLPQREAALRAWAARIEALADDRKVMQLQRPAA